MIVVLPGLFSYLFFNFSKITFLQPVLGSLSKITFLQPESWVQFQQGYILTACLWFTKQDYILTTGVLGSISARLHSYNPSPRFNFSKITFLQPVLGSLSKITFLQPESWVQFQQDYILTTCPGFNFTRLHSYILSPCLC